MYLQEKSESCGLFSTAMIYPSLIGGQGAQPQPRAICTYFKSESPSKSYLLCRTAALLPSRSLDNDVWRPTNSSSPVTMFGLTRGLAMSFRASIVWAGTSQRHQAPSYLPLPSSLMDELLAPKARPSAVSVLECDLASAPFEAFFPYPGFDCTVSQQDQTNPITGHSEGKE